MAVWVGWMVLQKPSSASRLQEPGRVKAAGHRRRNPVHPLCFRVSAGGMENGLTLSRLAQSRYGAAGWLHAQPATR
jgi:hypothetical protein